MNDVSTLERAPSTDLVNVEVLTPAAVFTAPGGVDAILKEITERVRAFKGDMSTAMGRKEIASFAHRVARSKTLLDGWGKKLGQNHYDSWKAISAERTRIEKALDALRDEVRKPLDDWENAEKARVDNHEQHLAALIDLGVFAEEPSLAQIERRIATLNATSRDWQEFTVRATAAFGKVSTALSALKHATEKREAERAELERLRQENAARERKEREDKIAAEAAERARKEAEARAYHEKAKALARAAAEQLQAEQELQRAEREKADAIARAERAEAEKKAAAEKAERDRKEAAARAERDKEAAAKKAEQDRLAAIETERKRVADAKAEEDAAAAEREANKRHAAKINKEVAAALVTAVPGLDERKAMGIVAAIARGDIPHTRIRY